MSILEYSLYGPGFSWTFTDQAVKGLIHVLDDNLTLHTSNQWMNPTPDPPYTSDIVATPSPVLLPLDGNIELNGLQGKVYVSGAGRILSCADPVGAPSTWVDEGYPATAAACSSVAANKSGANLRVCGIFPGDGLYQRGTFGGSWNHSILPAQAFGNAGRAYRHCLIWDTNSQLFAYDADVGLLLSTNNGSTWNTIAAHTSTADGYIKKNAGGGQYVYIYDGVSVWAFDTVGVTLVDTHPPMTPAAIGVNGNSQLGMLSVPDGSGVQHFFVATGAAPWTWNEFTGVSTSGIASGLGSIEITKDAYFYATNSTIGLAEALTRTARAIPTSVLDNVTLDPPGFVAGRGYTGTVTLVDPAAWGFPVPPSPINIVSSSWSNGVATHVLASSFTGQMLPETPGVVIAGSSRSGYNGTFTTLPTAGDVVRVPVANDPGGTATGGTLTPPGSQRVYLYVGDSTGRRSPDVVVPLYVDVPFNTTTATFSGVVEPWAAVEGLTLFADATPEHPQAYPNELTTTPYRTALMDLGPGTYTDAVGDTFLGGAYPGGANAIPTTNTYKTRGIAKGAAVVPRDPAGKKSGDAGYDDAHAVILYGGIGYSNVNRYLQDWWGNIRTLATGYDMNSRVITVNGAIPGHALLEWVCPPGVNPDRTGKTDYNNWLDPTKWKVSHSSQYPPIAGVTATWSGGVATFTLPDYHSLGVGTTGAGITGMDRAGYNGSWTVLDIPTPFTFTVTMSNPGGSGTGGTYTPPWNSQNLAWDVFEHKVTLSSRSLLQLQVLHMNFAVVGVVGIMKNEDTRFPNPPNAAGGNGFREGSVLDHQLWWLVGMRRLRSYAASRFPNLQQVQVCTREYGGFRGAGELDSLGDAEPYSYNLGIECRNFVNDSITDASVPWTGWMPRPWWADGKVPNLDGTLWPVYGSLDGTHGQPGWNEVYSWILEHEIKKSPFYTWFLP